jgi:Spy/CpxP family protein refolding chaperone
MLSKKLAAIAAVSMLTASSAAVAQSAQPLSLSNSPIARAGAVTSGENNLDRRGFGIYIVGAVVLGLVIWGIIELTKSKSP